MPNPKPDDYSHDATIRAGQAARAQSFTETTKTEQLHSGPPDPAEEETENADGTAKQPARYTDITPPANPNAKGAATPGAGAKAATKAGAKKESREELEALTVADLKELAAKRSVHVPSGSLKDDYVDALA